MNNVMLAASGFIVGFAIEGVLAVILIIVIIAAARKKKDKISRQEPVADSGEGAGGENAPAEPAAEQATGQESPAREVITPVININMPVINGVPQNGTPATETGQENMQLIEETAAASDDLEGKAVFDANIKSFDEAYAALSREQAGFFRYIKEYALQKPNAEEKKQANCICVKASGKQLLKLTIRRGITVAQFLLENDLLKDYKRQGNAAAIKVKATEVPVYDVDAMNTACHMVDLMEEQNERERQAAQERRKAARKNSKN